jgi:hypothetical protein
VRIQDDKKSSPMVPWWYEESLPARLFSPERSGATASSAKRKESNGEGPEKEREETPEENDGNFLSTSVPGRSACSSAARPRSVAARSAASSPGGGKMSARNPGEQAPGVRVPLRKLP